MRSFKITMLTKKVSLWVRFSLFNSETSSDDVSRHFWMPAKTLFDFQIVKFKNLARNNMEAPTTSRYLARAFMRAPGYFSLLTYKWYLLRQFQIGATVGLPRHNITVRAQAVGCISFRDISRCAFPRYSAMLVVRTYEWDIFTLPRKLYYLLSAWVSTTHTTSSWDML